MHIPRTPLLIAAALPLLASCKAKENEARADTTPAAAATPAANTKADEDTIRALGKRWVDYVAKRDTSGIGGMFADDGEEYIPNAPAAKGAGGVRKAFGGMFAAYKDANLTFEPSSIVVAQAGDVAVERGTYKMSFTDPKSRKKVEDHGNYVTAWKKVNGQWKVWTDINASEVPMP